MTLPKFLCLVAAALISAPLISACTGETGTDTTSTSETTGNTVASEVVEIIPIDSGSGNVGPPNPYVVVSDSLDLIRRQPGMGTADLPSGSDENSTYLAALWGEKNTGGFTVKIQSATLSGETATVVLRLREPPEDAIATQAITAPYSVVRFPDLAPKTTEFVLEDQSGERLDWPVRKLPSN